MSCMRSMSRAFRSSVPEAKTTFSLGFNRTFPARRSPRGWLGHCLLFVILARGGPVPFLRGCAAYVVQQNLHVALRSTIVQHATAQGEISVDACVREITPSGALQADQDILVE